ncbi:MAG: PD-(D/E)XK nuclease family protein [Chloroflexota bacterium]|nr:PD-(D/E)XK nuclease family protein [Chloroflexota bacterium]
MAVRRESPYVWVTWISKILAGEDSCEWASWFRAKHENSSYKRMPPDFDLATWQIKHTELLRQTRREYEPKGYRVFTQNQNMIRLQGRTSMLSGIPDLVAVGDETSIVIDLKTGQPLTSHVIQVLIYMYALSRTRRELKGLSLEGRVVYPEHEIIVPLDSVDKQFISSLGNLMLRLADNKPAIRVPSERECGFCHITAEDCPDRLESIDSSSEPAITEDF